MAKAPARKKGASRNNKPAPRKGGTPGWLWLLVGLSIGVFAAFLWHLQSTLKEKDTPAAITPAPATKPGKAPANSPASPAHGSGEEPRFDFYTLLPSQEVMSGKKPGTPAADAPKPATRYVLQAGAFKNEAEADQRRAELLLLGMQVKIQPGTGKAGEALHRVVVGPFEGKDNAEAARKTLHGSGVETLLLKQ